MEPHSPTQVLSFALCPKNVTNANGSRKETFHVKNTQFKELAEQSHKKQTLAIRDYVVPGMLG